MGEIRLFHGLAIFYRKFIRNFSFVCNAMSQTMRGDKKEDKWTYGADNSFETLKQNIVELSVLALLDFNKVFQVECDASGNAIGVILSQEGKPIAFFSEKLNDAKRKYFVYDRSMFTWINSF
ncbi:ribonuclease H family protein [Enterobacter hormaechei]|uniref:ribonuclease H family protein n=1 Tax=Enterobacter hormaechei TaxID=158836 RepID=UPI0023E43BF7|nr:ribonuclease H family protein [Enterobacter hormaechei]MDF3686283.1 RNase H-like domain-containing protein [Enterobacter hormaechei]